MPNENEVVHEDIHVQSPILMIEGEELSASQYQVTAIEIKKELNKITTARVFIIDGSTVTDHSESGDRFPASEGNDKLKPGNAIQIRMGYNQDTEVIFDGIIISHGIKIKSSGNSEVQIRCADKAIKTTVGRKNRYFKEKKDSDIMSAILNDAGVDKDVENTEVTHPVMVQYNATDWDFVLARAEANGKIVLVNDNKVTIRKPATSSSILTLAYGRGITKLDIEIDTRQQVKKVVTSSWNDDELAIITANSSSPDVTIPGDFDADELSTVVGPEEYKLFSPSPLAQDDLTAWANAQMMKSRLSFVRGTVSIVGNALPLPDSIIELQGLGARLNGEAYISKVVHEIINGNWTTELSLGLPAESFADASPRFHAPKASNLIPGIEGLFTGIVKNIHEDPNGETRIQVNIGIFDNEEQNNLWARMASPYAHEESGIFFVPEVGDEVIIGFLNSDPRFPIILGSLYGKKKKPPYTPDQENKIKAIVTKEKLKLVFTEDKKIIELSTPGGQKLILDDDKKSITLEDQHGNKIVMDDKGFTLDTQKDFQLSTMGKTVLEASQDVNITARTNAKLSGLNVEISGEAEAKLKAPMVETNASGINTVKGSLVQIN